MLPCLFASTIKAVGTSSERSSANIAELFHSGKLGLKIILKPIGKIGLVFKLAISLRNSIFIIKIVLPQMVFKSPASLLNA